MAQVYVHPDASSTVRPHLNSHLPSAIVVEHLLSNPPSQSSTFIASFPPSGHPLSPAPWSAAVVDLSRPNETELWFWSSAEESQGSEGEESDFRDASAHLLAVLTLMARMCPGKEKLKIGNLNSLFFPHIPPPSVLWVSEKYSKLVFYPSTLPGPSESKRGTLAQYSFRKMDPVDLVHVVASTSIPRNVVTLAKASSTAAYPTGSSGPEQAHAWCFISTCGSVSSLYVQPERRGEGLAKETMRREIEKGFAVQGRRFMCTEVGQENRASFAVCAALGAKKLWEVVWMEIRLDYYRVHSAAN
ncbi:hypothetical protein BV25DRAFT_1514696 [Artomyces pyxidatus]|uniref:Uncharacterized protein n=1 Tax=Artomyces pyxidatus TaxID=48021 RepID=A0ACB8TD65_9AGAM|nr:hypothetical protein BV25DRAFT_1514696 [Artomyces pyxidatus]